MIQLSRLQKRDHHRISRLKVKENQVQYVGTIQEQLKQAVMTSHYHIIEHQQDIVGFFNIDTAYNQKYDFSLPNELGLRAFFIDLKYQGRGFGRMAAGILKEYLRKHYETWSSMVLTVNCKNPKAYRCYSKAGFLDTGELFYGGAAGPQHIMRLEL